MAQEVINNVYDFSINQFIDRSTRNWDYIQVYDERRSDATTGQTDFRFKVHDKNSWLSFSESYLRFRMIIAKPDGTDLTANFGTEHAYFMNHIGAMIDRSRLDINGHPENVYHDYQYIKTTYEAYMKDANVADKQMALAGYDRELGVREIDNFQGSFFDNNLIGPAPIRIDKNPSARRRMIVQTKQTGNGITEYVAHVPLSEIFEFCRNYTNVIRGATFEIQIRVPDKQQLLINARGGAVIPEVPTLNWVSEGVSLFVKRYEPRPSISNMLNQKLLSSGGFKYPLKYQDCNIFQKIITAGATSDDWDIVNSISVPTKIVILGHNSIREDFYDTSAQRFPYDEWNVERARLFVNGQPIPKIEYDNMDKEHGKMRAFQECLEVMGLLKSDVVTSKQGIQFDYDDFKENFFHLTFDVANNLATDTINQGTSQILFRQQKGSTGGNVKLYALIYYEKDVIIQMNSTSAMVSTG